MTSWFSFFLLPVVELPFEVDFQYCYDAGYVQKITARKDIAVMEELDNGKPS